MQKKKKMHRFSKAVGLFCAIVMLVCALYIPMVFSASAIVSVDITDDVPFVFDFEDTVTAEADNEAEAKGEAAIGYSGWGWSIKEYTEGEETNKVLNTSKNNNQQSWATSGGYRLHTKKADGTYGFYELTPSTGYMVSFKIRVLNSPRTITGSSATATATLDIGYNSKYYPTSSGMEACYVNSMATKISVMSSLIDSNSFSLFDGDGKETVYQCGEEWIDVSYLINTPAQFTADSALAFWTKNFTGIDCEIDDVSVTRVGADSGVIILNDEYSGTKEYFIGKDGEEIDLTAKDISDRAQENGHIFDGWYKDEDRTEKIDKVAFSKGTDVVVYSRWQAPVTITFKDAVNKTEKVITGMAEESFTYPEDPSDPSGKSWFMGWYTDETYTTEHTSGKFGYANETVYAFFKGEIPGLTQDFENYDTKYDSYTVVTDANGQKYKSNRLHFFPTMTKQSEVTLDNSNYAIKYHWNPVQITDKNDENYYDTSRWASSDNVFNLGDGLENNTVYEVTLNYLAEKASAPVRFSVASSAGWDNIWNNVTWYSNPETVTLETDGKWHQYSFEFTTNYKIPGADELFLVIGNTENVETVLYLDNIEIKAFAQPYETIITINTNVNDAVAHVKGNRGDKIQLPELTHPEGAALRGYYLDKELTVPFEEGVYGRTPITLYVKWGAFAMTFEEYIYEGDKQNDPNIKRVTQAGIGNGDDHAMQFLVEREEDNTTGVGTTNAMLIAENIKHGTVYKVKFDYKVDSSHNVPMTLSLSSADKGNIWWSVTYSYPHTTVNIPIGGTDGWQTVELAFEANVKTDASYNGVAEELYLRFGGQKYKADEKINVLIDNVLVEEAYQPCIFLNGQNDRPGTVVEGAIGEEINLPTITHPEGAKFLGWYADADCTVPFTETTFTKAFTMAYAKWGSFTMTFKEYPYEGNPYADPNIHRETAPGLGNGDDYAMRWNLKRTTANTTNVGTSQMFAVYRNLNEGGIYRVKFDYKVNSSTNQEGSVGVTAAAWSNLWWSDVKTNFTGARTDFKAGGTGGWKTYEAYLNVEILESKDGKTDTIYISLAATGVNDAGTNIDVLIDNVLVEKVEAPYVYFDALNSGRNDIVLGQAGDEIKLPQNPERIGYDFAGWYLDKESTVKFDQKNFTADTAVIAYAKWTKSATSVYSFENYTLKEGVGFTVQNAQVVDKNAKSGKKSLKLGDRTLDSSSSFFGLEDSGEYFQLEYKHQYLVTINYYIKECGNSAMNFKFIASWKSNIYNGIVSGSHATVGKMQTISAEVAQQQKGKWCQKVFVVDTNDVQLHDGKEFDCLYVSVSGGVGWEIYLDDITITQIPNGKSLVVVDSENTAGIPTYFIGNVGADYSSKLPEKPEKADSAFKGYFTKSADGAFTELTRDNMKFGEKATLVYARFLKLEVSENFDGDFYDKAYGTGWGYTLHDFDYEVYDSEKEGNSKDNVTSGRYSLHRKGNSMYKENSVILTLGNQIAEGERYTVTFKVKMGKHFHTDGAVKIVSGRSYEYAWTTTGDYYPVVPVADLTDGQWHEVSYTFNSVESFLVVQTPGYVELFMDDFEFKLVDESVPLSEPPVYTEYVAAKRDANGNLVRPDRTAVDISTIIDGSLSSGSFPWLWIIIGAAAVLVIAGGVVAFVLVKKKKSKA